MTDQLTDNFGYCTLAAIKALRDISSHDRSHNWLIWKVWRENIPAGNYLKEIVLCVHVHRLTMKIMNTFVFQLATIANARCALIVTNCKLVVQVSQGMSLAVSTS